MDTLIHADIFFFVTTIAVVVVAAVFTVALIYLIKILRDVKEVTQKVREEASMIHEDIQNLRAEIKKEGFRLEGLLSFFRNIFKQKRSRTGKSSTK